VELSPDGARVLHLEDRIHDEMEYKGNRAIAEFSGVDVATLPPSARRKTDRVRCADGAPA
jgi:hypothetical protein